MKKEKETIDTSDLKFIFGDDYYEEDILTKCLKCGFENKVPDFIYAECGRKIFHKELG